MFTVWQLMILIAAVVGTAGVVGVMTWMVARVRRLELESSSQSVPEGLERQLERLRGELETLQGQIDRLDERAGFTEQL